MTFFLFFCYFHGLACCIFVSEGDQLVVSKEVSPQIGHPGGQQGVSPTGVCVVCLSAVKSSQRLTSEAGVCRLNPANRTTVLILTPIFTFWTH